MSDVLGGRKLKEVFVEALELPEDRREPFVRARCGDDSELADEVLELLAASERAGDFLGAGDDDLESWIGRTIGDYRLAEVIGVGGFGTVFAAVQERPFVRRVALKVVRPGMDSAQVVQRFEAERQTLALMDHPGIAKVLDAGTTPAGRPYFVMEFVNGEHLTTFCESRGVGLRERLRLFERVVRAVQHAHQKGVIHRDLKPGNILVTVVDGEPLPKIIDFGIAKAMTPDVPQRSLTAAHEIVGTPEYIAPEQALTGDIDTRVDVFSLGILLYRLVADESPYDVGALEGAGIAEWTRAIVESEPLPPSARATHPVPKELDWIVLRAIQRNPDDRYPTANALAADVVRHLSGEPVEAGPPTAAYRLKKLIRRHRYVFLFIAAVVGISLTAATVAARTAREARWQAYVANLFAADAALRERDNVSARRRLDLAAERHRGWEWEYFDRRVDASLWAVQRDPPSNRFTQDEARRWLASVWRDGSVRIHDALTGEELALRVGDGTLWSAIAFAPDGETLFGGDVEGVVWRWRWRDGIAEPLGEHGDFVVRAIPYGDELLTAARDGTVRLWDLTNGEPSRDLDLGAVPGTIALSPDRRTLVTTSWEEDLVFWDHDTWQELARVRAARETTPAGSGPWSNGGISAIAFSPDSSRVFTGCFDGNLTAWEPRTGERLWEHGGHADVIRSLEVSPQGTRLAAASRDRTISLWDTATFGEVGVLRGHDDDVRDVTFTPDGETLISSSLDRTLAFWRADDGRPSGELIVHSDDVYSVLIGPAEHTLLTRSEDGAIRSWSMASVLREVLYGHPDHVHALEFAGRELVTTDVAGGAIVWDLDRVAVRLAGLQHAPRSLALAVDAPRDRFATGAGDGSVVVRSLSTGEIVDRLRPHRAAVSDLAFGRDGKTLVSSSWDGTVALRDLERGVERGRLAHGDQVKEVALLGHDRRLATVSRDGRLRVWDLGGEELLMELEVADGAPLHALALHPDGKLLAAGGNDRVIEVFRLPAGRRVAALRGHAGTITALEWLPDGSRLVSGSEDRTVRLWHVETGENVATLRGHTRQVRSIAISDDGRTIASGAEDTAVRLWEIGGR